MLRPLLLCVLLVLSGPVRAAVPLPAGDSLADVTLWDLADRPVRLADYAGKVVVLVHEDRHAGDQNQALKTQLGRLWERHKERLVIVALAEVSSYDFWPARRYVKDALRKLSGERGAVLLCDWKGQVRKRYGLKRGDSSLIVLGPDGRVALARRGAFDPGEAQAALQRIQDLLPPP